MSLGLIVVINTAEYKNMIQTRRIWWPKAQERRSIIALMTKLGKIAYADYEKRKAKMLTTAG